ncbi:Transcription factor Iwr1 [Cordyceps militaris]|uniref:Transcription factor Iwr1 n=1 Tax=Cordyceps militaris TaxID=73501 RepID=A0A2H4SCS6_CORMI|nr:Transcription factor Iwr1 [Cordyceps militaris]
MSLPPNVIRVKRKRVEEAPVTFLRLSLPSPFLPCDMSDDSSHWVYQRRGSTAQQQQQQLPGPSPLRPEPQPRIQLSTAEDKAGDEVRRNGAPKQNQQDPEKLTLPGGSEPRRFRVSKAMLAAAAAHGDAAGSLSKGDRHGTPTLFVERVRRKKLAPKPRRSMLALDEAAKESRGVETRDLKRPGVVAKRAREAARIATPPPLPTEDEAPKPKAAAANPLPPSQTNRGAEDMSKIAADMNDWVMREMGANLQSMEAERQKAARPPLSPSRFKPRAPAKRYHERHPEPPAPGPTATDLEGDTNMTDASEDEDGDEDEWVIEEYVRVPANSVALDLSPADVGFLVLDGEEESLLFFGAQNDEDEDWDEDEEDENAENHYTADYPEDEVDSEDELNRNAYYFRNQNASDDEEYDQDAFDEEDDAASADGQGDDDDARMTRILEQMKRLKASQR